MATPRSEWLGQLIRQASLRARRDRGGLFQAPKTRSRRLFTRWKPSRNRDCARAGEA